MHRQLSQMTRLVEDLLDVSRISRGKLQVHKQTIELADVIRSAVDTVRPMLDAKKQELSLDLPDSNVLVNADSVRLSQVLSNLLNNATKYTAAKGRIALSVAVDGEVVRIQVTDNGKGISARTLPLIFMMFAQAEDSDMHGQSGLGVGLSLAKRLVELHGGMIYADSRGAGQGSTFTVQLPIEATQAASDVAQEETAPAADPAHHRVLLVDDNVDFVSSLSLLLRSLKHEVRVANDAPDALAALDEFEPDIAFLDIGLPTMDGFALARRIKEKSGGWIRLVAISGWGQDEYRRRAGEAGFSAYLVKPVDLVEIRAILASQSSLR
jgi:CheY-like chemotaxis protein/two-component sensor histidine kinase